MNWQKLTICPYRRHVDPSHIGRTIILRHRHFNDIRLTFPVSITSTGVCSTLPLLLSNHEILLTDSCLFPSLLTHFARCPSPDACEWIQPTLQWHPIEKVQQRLERFIFVSPHFLRFAQFTSTLSPTQCDAISKKAKFHQRERNADSKQQHSVLIEPTNQPNKLTATISSSEILYSC